MENNPYGRDHLMVIAAVRYSLGRMTYIVSDCCDWIIGNWNSWPENVKRIIQRDIEEKFREDDQFRADDYEYRPLGMDCDRAQWERVRKLWKKEENNGIR